MLKIKDIFHFGQNKAYIKCNAAEKSLRFGIGGRVSVCCHNHKDIVGSIPQNSIMEIWHGPAIKSLRHTLQKKYSQGCTYCIHEGQSVHSSGSSALYERYESNPVHPVILDFKADNSCNLACIMCSGLSSTGLRAKESKCTMNPYDNNKFLSELQEIIPFINEARFSGGEPFLSELYFKIWESIIQKNPQCKIVVQTNGTILNPKVRDIMERGNFNINLSIDSFQKDTYEKIRRGGSFDIILKNISYFKEYCLGQSRFWGMTSCAMIENSAEFSDIINNWNLHQANGWFSVVWFPPKNAIWTLSEMEIEKISEQLNNISFIGDAEYLINNSRALEILKTMMKQQLKLSKLHHDPPVSIDGEAFYTTVTDYFSKVLKQTIEFQQIETKLQQYFSQNGDSLYNATSFKKIRNFTSEEHFFDLLSMIDKESISELFFPFVTKHK